MRISSDECWSGAAKTSSTHDRPRHQVREEREVDRELLQRRRLEVAPVRVDDVADRHEGVEGDPDRKHDRLHVERQIEPHERREVVARGDEEVVVLEVAEDADVAREGEDQERLAPGGVVGSPDAHGEHLVPQRAGGQQEDEPPVPPAVEDVAGDDDERPPAVRPRHRQPRERQDDEEEDRERGRREEHAREGYGSIRPTAGGDSRVLHAASDTIRTVTVLLGKGAPLHRLLKRRPSPAMVVAGIALFVALGGTGVAAVSALAPNSVGPAQLKANAVTTPKIRNNAVTGAKVARNAITSSKVLDKSLIAADFADGQLPAGPAGPAGPQGPAGPSGVSGYQVVIVESPNDSNPTKKFTAACPAGKKVLGGGSQISGDGKQYAADNGAYPVGDASFVAEAQEVIATPQSWKLTVYAICATVS
jgi:hypothetical protein